MRLHILIVNENSCKRGKNSCIIFIKYICIIYKNTSYAFLLGRSDGDRNLFLICELKTSLNVNNVLLILNFTVNYCDDLNNEKGSFLGDCALF